MDSIPIVLDTKDPDEIVETLVRLRPTFGAVSLEDISAPRCFEIERRVIDAPDDDLAPDRIVPSPLDPRVGPTVAAAAAGACDSAR